MRILLTSTNEAKQKALQNIVDRFYDLAIIETISVDSGVSKTPTNDQEAIQGCWNRIDRAREIKGDYDAYVSFEGLISNHEFGMFLYGWCLFVDGTKNEYGLGASSQVMVPRFISSKISADVEFSDVVKADYPSEHLSKMPVVGSNGLFTNLHYTRVQEFEDAALCALGYLHNPANVGDQRSVPQK
ncbi:non-canonical (house-cleaning) NTP pyrophosphatase [Croceifilum oryzae]|uniref:inosine/xanthosine triphosphatase n=1 Tax=Croceifilum oryzae TaxID=1553429 RepID=A0AAJ1TPT8_9BACL|nr:inosine/xanthosine triphosphatase [Croceifilum oryzae]MDQ0418336.1 non-canonical (house-cleaning) NTP pyrophosphatase [Croceifilum oryzae]